MLRLFGLSSAQSNVTATRIDSRQDEGYVAPCVQHFQRSPNTIIYRLDFHLFQPGVDGECCVSVDQSKPQSQFQLDDDKHHTNYQPHDPSPAVLSCLIAPFQHLALTLKPSSGSGSINIVPKQQGKIKTRVLPDGTAESITDDDGADADDLMMLGSVKLSLRGNLVKDLSSRGGGLELEEAIYYTHQTSSRQDLPPGICSSLDVFNVVISVP
jgi:hypothetical protein